MLTRIFFYFLWTLTVVLQISGFKSKCIYQVKRSKEDARYRLRCVQNLTCISYPNGFVVRWEKSPYDNHLDYLVKLKSVRLSLGRTGKHVVAATAMSTKIQYRVHANVSYIITVKRRLSTDNGYVANAKCTPTSVLHSTSRTENIFDGSTTKVVALWTDDNVTMPSTENLSPDNTSQTKIYTYAIVGLSIAILLVLCLIVLIVTRLKRRRDQQNLDFQIKPTTRLDGLSTNNGNQHLDNRGELYFNAEDDVYNHLTHTNRNKDVTQDATYSHLSSTEMIYNKTRVSKPPETDGLYDDIPPEVQMIGSDAEGKERNDSAAKESLTIGLQQGIHVPQQCVGLQGNVNACVESKDNSGGTEHANGILT